MPERAEMCGRRRHPEARRLPGVLLVGAGLLVGSSGCASVNSTETIIADMTLPHERRPHGVPASFDWGRGPRIGMGNDPKGFRALIAWGQVYEAAEGNPATNTRVHVRALQLYVRSRRTGEWRRVQGPGEIEGSAFTEDFGGNATGPPDVRRERGGGVSVTAGEGYGFHFWSGAGRVEIEPDDVGGVFATCQARLILDDPAGEDDRGRARYVFSVGADYWTTLAAEWDEWRTNGDVGIGRFKAVTVEWQAFNMTSLSPDQVREDPPPLD